MIMDSKIEIIYKNADIKVANGRERVLNQCKKIFWNEAPEDWEKFDGEFTVKYKQFIGVHDCAIIVFHSANSKWKEIITRESGLDKSVYSINEIA